MFHVEHFADSQYGFVERLVASSYNSVSRDRMSLWVRCTEICHCQVMLIRPMLQTSLRFSKN
jgi:hypothetical protein